MIWLSCINNDFTVENVCIEYIFYCLIIGPTWGMIDKWDIHKKEKEHSLNDVDVCRTVRSIFEFYYSRLWSSFICLWVFLLPFVEQFYLSLSVITPVCGAVLSVFEFYYSRLWSSFICLGVLLLPCVEQFYLSLSFITPIFYKWLVTCIIGGIYTGRQEIRKIF